VSLGERITFNTQKVQKKEGKCKIRGKPVNIEGMNQVYQLNTL